MIRRVLIANRGEIALRIMRSARAMGIETVAAYSDADADAPFVTMADTSIRIGPAPATDSYLNIPAIIDAAKASGADAVHPGYGFLSEKAAFAEASEDAGLIFIGPPAKVMQRMGTKIGARALMAAAGVPVVPGMAPSSQSDADLEAAVMAVGLPVLLKAVSGGGGKGMRAVRSANDIADAVSAARQESGRAFASHDLYVERLIERPKHIEVQIFGDRHGSVLHLLERDCTLQRRHQKVIEEAPAPFLSAALRDRIRTAAVTAARAVGYINAGTVEFLVDGVGDDANFYFLEMNMRLQVEHPVTEAITGLDLVRLQFLVASGEPLPIAQKDVTSSGHAIEARVYAEDSRRLLPQSGRLLRYLEPAGDGIRVDGGVTEGQMITVHYDPLISKLIAHGATREEARARLLNALAHYEILGVRHNVSFLSALLSDPDVAAGLTHTHFIDEHLDRLAGEQPNATREAAAAIAAMVASGALSATREDDETTPPSVDPWDRIGPLRW